MYFVYYKGLKNKLMIFNSQKLGLLLLIFIFFASCSDNEQYVDIPENLKDEFFEKYNLN